MTAVPTVLDERFRAAAAASGELDVAYDVSTTRLSGRCSSASRSAGSAASTSTRIRSASSTARPALRPARAALAEGARPRAPELDEYFAGRRHAFDLELDLRRDAGIPPARARGAEPRRVRPHDDLRRARGAGRAPRAARAVGTVMNRNPLPIVLPCHRVVARTAASSATAAGSTARSGCSGWRARCSRGRSASAPIRRLRRRRQGLDNRWADRRLPASRCAPANRARRSPEPMRGPTRPLEGLRKGRATPV